MQSIAYAYTHVTTNATTGYFACDPAGLSFEAPFGKSPALACLEACPNDRFLHDWLLAKLLRLPAGELKNLFPQEPLRHAVRAALVLEAALLRDDLRDFLALRCPLELSQRLAERSGYPLPRWALQKDRDAVRAWSRRFEENITRHAPLPAPDDKTLPLPERLRAKTCKLPSGPGLEALHRTFTPPPPKPRAPAYETAALALERLMDADFIAGPEQRHIASLSPVALLREWPLDLQVDNRSLHYTLRGKGVSWGRGLSLADARVSYAMEMVERLSAYVSVKDNAVPDRLSPTALVYARLSELHAEKKAAINPNSLPVGLPYEDAPLHWMEAANAHGERVLVPFQAVTLFANLDETPLLLPPVSTGLASGSTLAQAKTAALLEVLERDAEATSPWNPDGVFRLAADDAPLKSLLAAYEEREIFVYFRELDTEFGVPVFECFVEGANNTLARATAASLSGKKALLSALTETPWPFPEGPGSVPAFKECPVRRFEELSDFSTGSDEGNLALLESLLHAHGYGPVYAELTRKDLMFPVVRAIVPGLELCADADPWSAPPARLVRRFLEGGRA